MANEEARKSLRENGYAVIGNVFTKSECDGFMDRMVSCIEQLGSGVDRNDLAGTWVKANLPPQTRPGMFQRLLGFAGPVEEVRKDPRLVSIFEDLYEEIGEKDFKDLVHSIDGVNIKPGTVGPFHGGPRIKDWAHLDQTWPDKFDCIQGQVVLTNTTAAFVCSPKSHLAHEKILKKLKVDPKKGFYKFSEEEAAKVKDLVEAEEGGEYQKAIKVEAGSVIVWLSSVVHSAKFQDASESPTAEDAWRGWRGVFYISFQPKRKMSKSQLKRREENMSRKRTMDHRSRNTFSVYPRFSREKDFHPAIGKVLKDPTLLPSV